MELYRVLRVSIYLIAASGAFAISIAEQTLIPLVAVLVFGGVVFKLMNAGRAKMRHEFFYAMMLALAVYFFWPPRDVDGWEHLPLALAHFLLSIQMLLFFADCRPGFLLAYCGTSTLAVILISGVIQGDATVLLRMACLVGLTAWTLFVYSLWRTREGFVVSAPTVFGGRGQSAARNSGADSTDAGSQLPENAFWQGLTMTGVLSLACLGLGLVLFFSAPRINERLAALIEIVRGERDNDAAGVPGIHEGRASDGSGNGAGPGIAVGWDEKLNVRTPAPVENNRQRAMTVTFSAPPATLADKTGTIFLRGMAYSDQREGIWTASPEYRKLEAKPNEFLNVVDPSTTRAAPRSPEIAQSFQLNLSTVSRVYFGIAPVIRINAQKVDVDLEGGLRDPDNKAIENYELWSQTPLYEEHLPNDAAAEHDAFLRYVRNSGLRVDVVDEVKALALRVTAHAATPLEKVRAIRDFLRDSKQYKYTLKLDELHRGGDPIYEFLMSTAEGQRRGHCQYFASAFVVLCRLNGIPARLASGFVAQVPANLPDDERSIVVSNSNAHSWGEVYFKDFGWIPFDAVPPSADNTAAESPHLAASPAPPTAPGLNTNSDDNFVAQAWNRVIGYNSAEQRKVYKQFGDALNFGFGHAGSVLSGRGASGWLGALMTWLVLSLILTWMLHMLLKRARRRNVKAGLTGQRARAAVAFYNDLLQVLSRRGYVRRAGQTPREFAEFVIKRGGNSFQPALVVTEVFENVRYGGEELSQEEFNRLQTALDALREVTFAGRE